MSFPIIYRGGLAKVARKDNPDWLDEVPMAMVRAVSDSVTRRYNATVDQVAAAGLTPHELLATLKNKPPGSPERAPIDAVMAELLALVAQHEAKSAATAKVLAEDEARTDDG